MLDFSISILTKFKAVKVKGSRLATFLLVALATSLASGSDPSPLQDFCVAVNDTKLGVFTNGKFCKSPERTRTEDFIFRGFNIRADTDNELGVNFTVARVNEYPGVNTLGISRVRIDFARDGVNPPHFHPRASESLVVLKGKLYAGFISSYPEYRLFAKVLHPGDAIVFPVGLLHFQWNVGDTEALALSAFNSQDSGLVQVAEAVFGSNPPIRPRVLIKAFKLDKKVVKYLQEEFGQDSCDQFSDITGSSDDDY